MVHLGDDAQVEAYFSLFGDSANLEANRCMVCAEQGLEIILTIPDRTPR